MTNFEKYKDDLIKIEGRFAVDKAQRRIMKCDARIGCENCIFNEGNCFESDKIKWLYSEYEEPILSNNELESIKALSRVTGKEYKYIYRSGKNIFIFFDKPNIGEYGIILDGSNYLKITGHTNLFPNITHEDGLYDIKNKCFIEI